MDCLHLVLKRVLDKEGALPPVLFLQLDNTSKQCKSRHMLGFLGILVHLGVHQDVWLSFLPVGHTHEDIDQFFSRVSVYLRQHDARSRIGIEHCVTQGYNKIAIGAKNKDKDEGEGRAHVIHRDRAANMSDHLDAHVANLSADKEADNFSARRQFHVFRRPVSFSPEEEKALGARRIERFRKEVGYEVHLEARTDAKGDWTKAWMTGMRAYAASTRVFKYGDPATMDFLLDRAACFTDVPAAQPSQPAKYDDDVDGLERQKDLAKITRDVKALMEQRLGFTEEDKEDLEECLHIINSKDALEFDWDLAAYKLDQGGEAQAGLQDVVPPAVALFRQLMAEKKLDVGAVAAFMAPDEDPEFFYIGKVKALHEQDSELQVEWYQRGSVVGGKSKKCETAPRDEDMGEPAKQRVYYLTKNPVADRVHSETLQTVVTFKAAKTFFELDTESARNVQFYIDMRAKQRQRDQADANYSDISD